jgi:hypothetical protein
MNASDANGDRLEIALAECERLRDENRRLREQLEIVVIEQSGTPVTQGTITIKSSAEEKVKHIVVLKGGMGIKQQRVVAEQLTAIPEEEERILLATGRYIGEGFDDARLDTLFLTTPVSWRGTLQQYVGRLHRLHANKREVIVYDYVDDCVPVFSAMYSKRVRGYEAVRYEIQDENNFSETFPNRK